MGPRFKLRLGGKGPFADPPLLLGFWSVEPGLRSPFVVLKCTDLRMGSFPSLARLSKYWIAGHPKITSFEWTASTWGSSWQFLLGMITGYLLLIAVLCHIMKKRSSPMSLAVIPILHNVLILSLSALMAVGCWESARIEMEKWGGPCGIFCFPVGTLPNGRVFFWSYVFYLSKYYEFVDTIILVLKKRPLTFLHVYHHTMIVVMCFLWLEQAQSLQIIALITNASVHTLMYTYYFLCSIGCPPPWKKLVTNFQIVQFLFSFLVSTVFLWLHFTGDGCAGMKSWIFNALFNASLLMLFFNFHKSQYRRSKKLE